MVCAKCEKRLGKVAATDPFRNRDAQGSLKASTSSGTNKVTSSATSKATSSTTNKLLSNKNRYSSTSGGGKCKICSTTVTLQGGTYCHNCAYKRGVCARCGKMLLDKSVSKGMKMSS